MKTIERLREVLRKGTQYEELPWIDAPERGNTLGGIVGVCGFGIEASYYPVAGERPEDEEMALILAAVNNLPALLDIAEAAIQVHDCQDPDRVGELMDVLGNALDGFLCGPCQADCQDCDILEGEE
ncbi:MAG: hypothetical protein GY700_06435 [Propionibacteriaceae bacterium]|nr:hypothetical protein [Propionibacteriaceae bacterium]